MKKLTALALLHSLILMTLNNYAQPMNNPIAKQVHNTIPTHGQYDTLRTASHIPGLTIAILHEAPVTHIHKPVAHIHKPVAHIDRPVTVINKAPVDPNDYPILFLHGSVIPVNVSFGFRMNNYSWMDNLADNGYDVYALDFLGYGNSDRYPGMSSGSWTGTLPGRATDAYLDVDKAVDFICRRTGKSKVYLIAHSWGGSVAALYTGKFNSKVAKLILYAPLTPKANPTNPALPAIDHNSTTGHNPISPTASAPTTAPPATIQSPCATMTPAQRVATFQDLTPPGKECRMEKEMFTTFGNTWLLSDPLHKIFSDDSVRFPSGPEQDTEDLLHGSTYYDPRDIQVPVLLVRGEWDTTPTNNEAEKLFTALENAPHKKYVVIEKATHILHLEKSRYELYDEVLHFLHYSTPPPEPLSAR